MPAKSKKKKSPRFKLPKIGLTKNLKILLVVLTICTLLGGLISGALVVRKIMAPRCSECEGMITEMTMEYTGERPAKVKVVQKSDEATVFDETVEPGKEFTFKGTWDQGTLSNTISIYTDDQIHTVIDTSCSDSRVAPGAIFGNFKIVAAKSKLGGNICQIPEIICQQPPDLHCPDGGEKHDSGSGSVEKNGVTISWSEKTVTVSGGTATFCVKASVSNSDKVTITNSSWTVDWKNKSEQTPNISYLVVYEAGPESTPTPTSTPESTPTPTNTPTPTPTGTPGPTGTPTPTSTPTPTGTPVPSSTPTPTPTISPAFAGDGDQLPLAGNRETITFSILGLLLFLFGGLTLFLPRRE
ncbi:hypothetical protein ACFL0Y_00450 [Patescibacteria group bacterium]